jgi:hypothetical protein
MNHYGMLGFHGKYEGADQLFNIEDFSFDQRSKEKMKVKHMEEIPQNFLICWCVIGNLVVKITKSNGFIV